MLAGSSQPIASRSASWPKTGCTTEDVALIAKTRPAAAAFENPRPSTRNGARAGTTPWHRSIRKWPTDSRARARRFIRTSPGVRRFSAATGYGDGIIFAMMKDRRVPVKVNVNAARSSHVPGLHRLPDRGLSPGDDRRQSRGIAATADDLAGLLSHRAKFPALPAGRGRPRAGRDVSPDGDL